MIIRFGISGENVKVYPIAKLFLPKLQKKTAKGWI
jgi:hypothetical protein